MTIRNLDKYGCARAVGSVDMVIPHMRIGVKLIKPHRGENLVVLNVYRVVSPIGAIFFEIRL